MEPVPDTQFKRPSATAYEIVHESRLWDKVAAHAFCCITKRQDPSQMYVRFDKLDAQEHQVLDMLGYQTQQLCNRASDRYPWFEPRTFWEFFETIRDCCAGGWKPELVREARILVPSIWSEMDRVWRTILIEIQSSATGQTQTRLQAVLEADRAYLWLDGKVFPATEVAVHFVAALIKANGLRVSFAEWVRNNPRFERAISNRVLKKIPKEVARFVERSQGRAPRLRTELLQSAP
jgi:hypothetical protein